MTNDSAGKNVLICDTQPVAVEGMKWLLENSGDLRFAGAVSTLEAAYELLHPVAIAPSGACAPPGLFAAEPGGSPDAPIDAIVVDKGLGLIDVLEWLRRLIATGLPTAAVVWGAAISESEALRLLQAGARGILRRTSESGTLLTCLRAVTSGGAWMEDGIFGSTENLYNPRRSQLTARESEVVVLVEKGFRNRDIARSLGIQTGTVKIHLKHIFEKTGVRGRYGLALTGLRDKGTITLPPPHFTV
jgi:DNA-binding NarL/FixJ family response regulator